MATKKREPKSLSSMAFAAIMGQGSVTPEAEQEAPAMQPEQTPRAADPKLAAKSVRTKATKPEPVPEVIPEPVVEAAPIQQRRPGRPASKSPKRNYGVSLCIEDYEALREMAKGSDKSITELLTLMIAEYDRHHPELREKYRKIQALLNS